MRKFVVAAIDDDRIFKHHCRIGLGANVLGEFSLKRQDRWRDSGIWEVRTRANELGLADVSYYGVVNVSYEDREEGAMVYNAFGKLYMGEEKIRISSKLAQKLELRIGDVVGISKP
jgi:hypothetical protein